MDGFNFECEGNGCGENGPNPLCCFNGEVRSNENFGFNRTYSDECQCLCDDSFTGKLQYSLYCLEYDNMRSFIRVHYFYNSSKYLSEPSIK